jgi:hypothetical protein
VPALRGFAPLPLRGAQWAWQNPAEERPTVLAVDIGSSLGWCVLSPVGHVTIGSSVGETKNPALTDRMVVEIQRAASSAAEQSTWTDKGRLALLVVEDVFMRDPATHAALSRIQGATIALAMAAGIPCAVRVMSVSWQSKMIGKNLRALGKEASITRARMEFGPKIANEHEADAALMCLWAWGVMRPARR